MSNFETDKNFVTERRGEKGSESKTSQKKFAEYYKLCFNQL